VIAVLGYHLFIAWKSLRRRPGNTLIILAGIALGVAVATLFSTIHHAFAKDPVPAKSGSIYHVHMDNWDPKQEHPAGFPKQTTYRDMVAIMKSGIPIRRTGSFRSTLRVRPGLEQARHRMVNVRVCHADFFAMFDVPFRYGAPWDRKADDSAEPVAVLNGELNDQWFGGANSVGRAITIDGRAFRVIGVLDHFEPPVKYYDPLQGATWRSEQLFLSMGHVWPMKILTAGAMGIAGSHDPSFEGVMNGEATFLQMWVELAGPADVAAYRSFLDAYTLDQRRLGRFQRPLNNRVVPLLEYLDELGVTPPEATAVRIAGDLFLAACALSLMGLLLARFLARAPEIGVRRALGASRWDVFVQHVIECELVAMTGGLLGLGLAAASLFAVNRWYLTISGRDDLFRMDLPMTAFSIGASLAAGLLAGAYPAYRVCRIAPASHLKIQ
jgi:putative ABC transport system permease protein